MGSGGFGSLGDDVGSFDDCPVFGGLDFEDSTLFATVFAGEDVDIVTFFDVEFCHFVMGLGGLEYLGSEGDDFHVCGAEFAGDGAEDAGAAEFAGVVEQDAGVVVEADV